MGIIVLINADWRIAIYVLQTCEYKLRLRTLSPTDGCVITHNLSLVAVYKF